MAAAHAGGLLKMAAASTTDAAAAVLKIQGRLERFLSVDLPPVSGVGETSASSLASEPFRAAPFAAAIAASTAVREPFICVDANSVSRRWLNASINSRRIAGASW